MNRDLGGEQEPACGVYKFRLCFQPSRDGTFSAIREAVIENFERSLRRLEFNSPRVKLAARAIHCKSLRKRNEQECKDKAQRPAKVPSYAVTKLLNSALDRYSQEREA